ncbi:DMT family transporter [Microvirga sp. TS319]|uniref:DMT family transporter n=1 Tax=Microvirga sp. TS319 TaxID=3241165 RepID=UPI00351A5C68
MREQAQAAKPRNIFLCLLAMAFFSTSDILAKMLSVTLHPLQIAWFRYMVAIIAAAPLLTAFRGRIRSQHHSVQLVRGAAMLSSTLFLIAALRLLPVAEATALVFVSPLIITTLSVLLLREVVSPLRWLIVLLGFLGVLIIIRPGNEGFAWTAFLPLCSSLCWALGVIYTRKVVAVDTPLTTLVYSAVTGFVAISALVPFNFISPTMDQLLLGTAMGLLWVAAHICITLAYSSAPASQLAPYSFTQIIWAALLGYLVFSHTPDALAILGCGVIIASGMLSISTRLAAERCQGNRSSD